MKSMIMISATGSIPSMAAPIAAPTIAASEIGVSSTRSWPYFVERPAVGPDAPGIGDVLTEQKHPVVGLQRLVEREVECLAHRHLFFFHDVLGPHTGNLIGVAYTSRSSSSIDGDSAFMTMLNAASTVASASLSMRLSSSSPQIPAPTR